MPTTLPADLSPNAMLVASLVLVVLLLAVFFGKSLGAERRIAAAKKDVEAHKQRAAALEEQVRTREPVADQDDVVAILHDLSRALRVPDEARTHQQIGEALGAGLDRTLDPEQWMVFADVDGDGKHFTLVASRARSGGTWPYGAQLSPQMGRVGLAIRRKAAMDNTDFLAEPPIVRDQVAQTEPKAFRVDLVIPVVVRDRVVGALTVGGSKLPSHVSRAVLQVFADRAAILHQLTAARQRAMRLENMDNVTGLHNRNWFTAQGSELLFRRREQISSATCAVIGVDDFRIYAGREGPGRAQDLLRGIANLIRPEFRDGDLVCRWTEEEFALLLPGTDRSFALDVLDRIRHRVATEPFPGAENQPEGAVTVSVGLASAPDDGDTLDALLDHAYRAFQAARGHGRDRTSSEPAAPPATEEFDDEFIDVVSGLDDDA